MKNRPQSQYRLPFSDSDCGNVIVVTSSRLSPVVIAFLQSCNIGLQGLLIPAELHEIVDSTIAGIREKERKIAPPVMKTG
jgi:hypothetical protein